MVSEPPTGVQAQGQPPLDQLGIPRKRLKRIRRLAALFAKTYDLRAGSVLERLARDEGVIVVDLRAEDSYARPECGTVHTVAVLERV